MKKSLLLFSALIALMVGNNAVLAQKSTPVTDTIYMGPGYVNEVYYSMSSGNQGAVNRKQWDIAFRTSRMSASILTNDASNNNALGINGVELYTYDNADTSGWASFDTTGFYTLKNMVNSTTDWETGAFCQYQLGHPDYGWGRYNSATHDVVGDSLYVIKLRDGSFRKLWIMRKYSSLNQIEFRYANLDGSADTTVLLDCSPYSAKNFVGFSMTTGQIVDFEPAPATNWDLLFAKYMYTYPDGTLYPVTGVLSNYETKVNKFEHVAPDFRLFDLSAMDSTRSPIGWEWKYLDANFTYHVTDSLVHFIQDAGGDIYRLVFKEFVGSSTGRIVLEKELLSLAGIGEGTSSAFNMAVYPNPASVETNLVVNPGSVSQVAVRITDLGGKQIKNLNFSVLRNELNTLSIPVNNIPAGVYMITLISGNQLVTKKLFIQ